MILLIQFVFLLLLVDYIGRFSYGEQCDTILKYFVSSLRAKSIVEVSLLTSFLVYIVSTSVLFPVLKEIDNSGVYRLVVSVNGWMY
jgi:hypothetical protein